MQWILIHKFFLKPFLPMCAVLPLRVLHKFIVVRSKLFHSFSLDFALSGHLSMLDGGVAKYAPSAPSQIASPCRLARLLSG